MSRLKRALASVAMVAVSVAGGWLAYENVSAMSAKDSRLSVLVVSLCSFRLEALTHYGHEGPSIAPAIDRFIEDSTYVFDKMFNGVSWTSLFGFTGTILLQNELVEHGYQLFGPYEYWQAMIRIPQRQTELDSADDVTNDNDFEKNHQQMTDYVRAQVTKKRTPFYVNAHYKYLHYPLIDRFNKDSGWDRYLSAEDRARLDELLAHPETYFRKLPLLLMLTNDPKYALAHPDVRKRYPRPNALQKREVTGLLTNRKFLDEWQAEPDYKADLQLLEKVYAGNVSYIDRVVEPMLNLYGIEELKDNTLVVFTPDHGELHMERGFLTHGESLYDESLRVPMAIRVPGVRGHEVVREQFEFRGISKLLREVVRGEVTRANFRERLMAMQDDVVIARDCRNSLRGMRYQNKWKYFVRLADGERFLYDLETDPAELKNVALERPEIVEKLEDLYWQRYPENTSTNVYRCAPWMVVSGP